MPLRFIIYQSLAHYNEAIEDFEKVVYYKNLVSEVKNKRASNIKLISNQISQKLVETEVKSQKDNDQFIVMISFLVVLIVGIVWFFSRKNRKQKLKYNAIISRLEARENKFKLDKTKGLLTVKDSNQNGSMMPEDTEARLLAELEIMENSKFYLQKDVSLAMLATEINTNSKYLSHIINTHKQKDFNNYMNELRIFHVIEQLRNDPNFLKYKLAFIADQSGFSSHSKFTAVFKRVTGLSPSAFIAELKKELNPLL